MDAIKKKMQAMKLEKEAALDKADQLEQALNEQKEKNEKVKKLHRYILQSRSAILLEQNPVQRRSRWGFKITAVLKVYIGKIFLLKNYHVDDLCPPSWIPKKP